MGIARPRYQKDELAIRKWIGSIFNKRQEDFKSLREYNDYLEDVENMIFDLVAGVDVPVIEAKIAEYQKENAEQIVINEARKAEELAAALEAGKRLPGQLDTSKVEEEAASNKYMGQIDASKAQEARGPGGSYVPTAATVTNQRATVMAPQPISRGRAPQMRVAYDGDDEETVRLRAERGSRAGGWSLELSKKRALEEAFSSIWI